MNSLSDMKCVPCRGGIPPLSDSEIDEYRPQVPGWDIVERDKIKRLERIFKVKNFAQALEFTNLIGQTAEKEDHHPVLKTEWGRVTVTWWTHKIRGLHQNDFIMAAKTDELFLQFQ